jgi:hypothetical protein
MISAREDEEELCDANDDDDTNEISPLEEEPPNEVEQKE